MQILEKLFGSEARVKVLRFFLLNPEKVVLPNEISQLLKISSALVLKEARFLGSAGFLKRAFRVDVVVKKYKTKEKRFRRRVFGFQLNQIFPLLMALRNLLINASPVSREQMLKYFKSKGKVKLLALGGIFVQDFSQDVLNDKPRLDLLIVSDLKKWIVEQFIKKLESEVGKELNWTILSPFEFDHRMSMHDRLLRDFFDYPHEFLINKFGIG